jgi:ribosomal-protein-alanine N-acetyltransferase
MEQKISVRLLEGSDHEKIVDYFLDSDQDFLIGLGVDLAKLPERQEWLNILNENAELGIEERKFFYIIWLLDDKPIGHSNINKIIFGEEAYMHLHIWYKEARQKGAGIEFLKLSLPYYYKEFNLENIYCEPAASNPAPNRSLRKLGFEFVKSYDTIPGWINSYQTVNRWVLSKDKFNMLYTTWQRS